MKKFDKTKQNYRRRTGEKKTAKIRENPTTINQLFKSNTKIEKSELSPSVGTVPFLVRKTKCVKKKERKKPSQQKLSNTAV